MDVQEALKLLQYRLGKEVRYRPVAVRDGLPVYRVDGRLLTEAETLERVASLGGRRGWAGGNGDVRSAGKSMHVARVSSHGAA
jgi:hypothetical protein